MLNNISVIEDFYRNIEIVRLLIYYLAFLSIVNTTNYYALYASVQIKLHIIIRNKNKLILTV